MRNRRTFAPKLNLQVILALLLIAYGLGRFFVSAYSHPPTDNLQQNVLIQLAISVFYVFCGVWTYIGNPGFGFACAVLFISFILEMSQIGAY